MSAPVAFYEAFRTEANGWAFRCPAGLADGFTSRTDAQRAADAERRQDCPAPRS